MKFLRYTDDTVHSEFYSELRKAYLEDADSVDMATLHVKSEFDTDDGGAV